MQGGCQLELNLGISSHLIPIHMQIMKIVVLDCVTQSKTTIIITYLHVYGNQVGWDTLNQLAPALHIRLILKLERRRMSYRSQLLRRKSEGDSERKRFVQQFFLTIKNNPYYENLHGLILPIDAAAIGVHPSWVLDIISTLSFSRNWNPWPVRSRGEGQSCHDVANHRDMVLFFCLVNGWSIESDHSRMPFKNGH